MRVVFSLIILSVLTTGLFAQDVPSGKPAASILLLIPSKAWLGSIIALGTISGAIFSHLTMLGIEVKGDGGLLFGLAVTVFVLSSVVLLIHRRELPILGQAF